MAEEETTVVIGNLEERLGYFYKFGIRVQHDGHHGKMMACLMRAYRIRQFGEHPGSEIDGSK